MSTLTRSQFDRLVKPLRPGLLRYAASRCGRQDAEDVVQDALLRAFQEWDPFAPAPLTPPEMMPRLLPTLRLTCDSFRQKARRRRDIALPAPTLLLMAEHGDPPDISGDVYLAHREAFYALLERVTLKPLQETCIRLWLDGHSQQQIGDYLGVNSQTVCYHQQAGAKKMRHARPESVDSDVREILNATEQKGGYVKPACVWDRTGNAAQIDNRRQVAALEAYDARRSRASSPKTRR